MNREETCVFCAKIRNNGDEHGPVYPSMTDTLVVSFEPLNPVTPGHMLFVPTVHDWHSFTIGRAFRAADTYGNAKHEDYNLIISRGDAATQTVDHPHVHYVPRRAGDGLLLPWSPLSKVTGRLLP